MIPRSYKAYVSALAVTAVVVAALVDWPPINWSEWYLLAILALLIFMSESLAFELPVLGSVSLAFALAYAALLYAGPIPGALVALAGAVSPSEVAERKPLWLVSLNVVQIPLVVLAAGAVYIYTGGVPLSVAANGQFSGVAVMPSVAAAGTLFLLNVLIVSVGIALCRSLTLKDVWRLQHTANYFVSFVGLALLGALMSQLIAVAGWIGIVLLLLPLVVARQTFQVYQGLSQAYSETIRSLIAAIEAKDPYTRGHSERVAGYTNLISQAISLAQPEAKMLEFAALLHDLGKIGVHKETLVKRGKLTREEFVQIRQHPEVGKTVLEAVEFLADIVPVVYSHHERPDGSGYPLGLQADEIPRGARILAVADCFDAMTSNRAYRQSLTIQEARLELLRVAGTQLDAGIVDAFLKQIAEERDIDTLAERMGAAIAQPIED